MITTFCRVKKKKKYVICNTSPVDIIISTNTCLLHFFIFKTIIKYWNAFAVIIGIVRKFTGHIIDTIDTKTEKVYNIMSGVCNRVLA